MAFIENCYGFVKRNLFGPGHGGNQHFSPKTLSRDFIEVKEIGKAQVVCVIH